MPLFVFVPTKNPEVYVCVHRGDSMAAAVRASKRREYKGAAAIVRGTAKDYVKAYGKLWSRELVESCRVAPNSAAIEDERPSYSAH